MERVQVQQTGEGVIVDVRHPRSIGWLAASWVVTIWGVGALVAISLAVTCQARGYVVLFLFALGMPPMIFLPYALFMAPWLSSGHEIATVEDGLLILRSVALGVPGPARRFQLDHVHNLRFEPMPNLNRRLMHSIVMDPGSLAFDYGSRTVRFGRWLSGDEAQPAVAGLNTALTARWHESRDPVDPGEAMILGLPLARHRITDANESLTVRMPFGNTPLNRRTLAVALVGMLVTMLTLGMVMGSLFSDGRASSPRPLLGVLPIGIVLILVVPILVVSLLPVETARLSNGVLEVGPNYMVLTMVPKRRYDIRYIHNLRYEPLVPGGDDLAALWTKHFKGDYGQIAFGYGAEQHRLGQFLDAPEARQVAEALNVALSQDPSAGTLAWEAYQAAQGQPAGHANRG